MLSLKSDQLTALAALAEAAFPCEACALLVGREHGDDLVEISRIIPAANVAAHPERGFEIDPSVHIGLLRDLRERNARDRVVGHWHSHPNGRPEPSATDAAMVHDPGLVWLISAVDGAGLAQPPRAFRPQPDGRFDAMPIDTASGIPHQQD